MVIGPALQQGCVGGPVQGVAGVQAPVLQWNGSDSDMKVGYAVGGGLEYALTNNLTIKGEYLYASIGAPNGSAVGWGGNTFAVINGGNYNLNIARGGVVDDDQQAARLEHREEALEHALGLAGASWSGASFEQALGSWSSASWGAPGSWMSGWRGAREFFMHLVGDVG